MEAESNSRNDRMAGTRRERAFAAGNSAPDSPGLTPALAVPVAGPTWATSGRLAGALAAGVGVLGAVVAGAVLAISAYAAHTVVRPRRDWQPDFWSEPAHELEAVEFTNSAGQRLAGWFMAPEGGRTVAILCHGFGTNRREGVDLVPWLAERGYGALLFDFQAHGESDGRYTTVGLREVDDLLSAVRFVQRRLGDGAPIAVIGFSMGGSVAIMAAAHCASIGAVVADSPFATLHRVLARSFRAFFHLPPHLFALPTIWFAERLTGGRVGGVQPINSVAAIAPRPLLIIHGTADRLVDPEDSALLYAAAGEPKSLWRVEGAGHVQTRVIYPEEYFRRVKDCLDLAAGGSAGNGPAGDSPAG
jgi:alpha-beta hydrolase superfamily lysophospholipase